MIRIACGIVWTNVALHPSSDGQSTIGIEHEARLRLVLSMKLNTKNQLTLTQLEILEIIIYSFPLKTIWIRMQIKMITNVIYRCCCCYCGPNYPNCIFNGMKSPIVFLIKSNEINMGIQIQFYTILGCVNISFGHTHSFPFSSNQLKVLISRERDKENVNNGVFVWI